jgi:hypothetical protein
MTAQLKAIQRHHQRAYQARVQFMREHGIVLTPREIVEAQREQDRLNNPGMAADIMRNHEDNEL